MPVIIDPDAFYSETEYAAIVGKKINTVRKDKSRGTGPAFCKLGAETFFRGSDILAHLDACRVRHGAEYKAARARQQAKGVQVEGAAA